MLTLPQFKFYSWKTSALTPPLVYDTYYGNTTLLITKGGLSTSVTNNVFVDNSSNKFTIVSTGSTAQQGSFSPFDPNGWSIYSQAFTINGIHNYISFPAMVNTPGHGIFGGGKTFTIEGWFYLMGGGGGVLCDSNLVNSSYWNFYFDGTRKPAMSWYDGSPKSCSSLVSVPLEEWTHLAWVASAGNISMYIDGIKQQLGGNMTYMTNPKAVISYNTIALANMNAYTSNFRVLTGTALYNNDFNPPTSQLSATPNTVLLIAQDSKFKDVSQYNRTLTISNSAFIQPVSPFKKYIYSNNISRYFNGGTILSAASSQDFNMGNDSFTIDFWIRSDFNQGNQQYNNRVFGIKKLPTVNTASDEAVYFEFNTYNKACVSINSGTTIYTATDTENFPINQWVHVALVRNGASLKLYKNGILAANTSVGGVSLNFSNFGMSFGGKDYYSGVLAYVSKYAYFNIFNLRIIKGQPLYTGNFTPPTSITNGSTVGATGDGVPTQTITGTVSLLAFQDKSNTDYSPSPKTIGSVVGTTIYNRTNPFLTDISKNPIKYTKTSHGGSMYFDGTNKLTSDFNKLNGTGDFTIEMWIYPTSYSQMMYLLDLTPSEGTAGNYPVLRYTTNKTLQYLVGNIDDVGLETTAFNIFQWTHIAVCRKENITKLYVNGIQNGGSYIDYTNFLQSSRLIIGGNGYTLNANGFVGYISNCKIIVNNAIYDGNFTPANTPYKYDEGTEFHLAFNNAYIVDSTGNTVIQTISSSSFSNASGGIYFDGTGYLKATRLPSVDAIHSAQTDIPYTIEGYFAPTTSSSGIKTLIAKKSSTSTGTDYELCLSGTSNSILYYNNTNLMYAGSPTTDGGTILSSGYVSTSQWTHIAVVYDGGNYSIYKNGNRIYKYSSRSGSTGTQTAINTVNRDLYIGNSYPFNRQFTGNMKNIRITKGVARYTGSSFTVPTQFPTQ